MGEAAGPKEMPPSCSSTPPTPCRARSGDSRAPGATRGPRSHVSKSSFSAFPSRRPCAAGLQGPGRAQQPGVPAPRRTPHPALTGSRSPVVVGAQRRVRGDGPRDARRALAHLGAASSGLDPRRPLTVRVRGSHPDASPLCRVPSPPSPSVPGRGAGGLTQRLSRLLLQNPPALLLPGNRRFRSGGQGPVARRAAFWDL